MTLGNLQSNLFSTISTGSTFAYGDRSDLRDRKSGFDFRLHVPGLSRYLTLYADSYADDEPNPLDAPRRVVWHPGMYVARFPFFTHADFRLRSRVPKNSPKMKMGLVSSSTTNTGMRTQIRVFSLATLWGGMLEPWKGGLGIGSPLEAVLREAFGRQKEVISFYLAAAQFRMQLRLGTSFSRRIGRLKYSVSTSGS